MTRKVYRTANGKMVDLGALQLQNEHVRAVGNMGVNARGDIIDSQNKSIDSRNRQVAKQYRKQTTNVADQPVAKSRRAAQQPEATPVAPPKASPVAAPAAVPQATAPAAGGLAAAIAKAREIKQEALDPAPSRTAEGLPKI